MLKNSGFDSIETYLDFYDLKFAAVRYEFMPFKSNGFELAGHIFRHANYKATVVILHGYLNHCGLLSKLIEFLLEADFAVACFDLPGHGLSAGTPADIEDFSQYTQALADFMNFVKPKLHSPYHLIGHSTGGSCTIDYLLTENGKDFDRIILATPLIHSIFWNTSKIVYKFCHLFSKQIPRVFRRNSSDKDFLQFVKYKDPLQARKLPLQWIKALYNWNDKIVNAEVCDKSILIIQGKADSTVDYKFNIRFLQSKFPDTQIKLLENARHELFNESREIHQEVFRCIKDWLDK